MSARSYIVMPAAKVAELAEQCIKEIELYKARRIEERLVPARENRAWLVGTWWGRLWRLRMKTDKELLRDILRDDMFFHMEVEGHGWENLRVARRLLVLARAAEGGDVHITANDLYAIS